MKYLKIFENFTIMNSFLVEINSEEELINGIKMLDDIGALGTDISFGTYMPDSYSVSDIINKKINIWRQNKEKDNICAFSVNYDDDKYRNETFPNLYGKCHIQVGLVTKYDVSIGDIPTEKVHFNKMVEETLKLINSLSINSKK